MDSIERALQNFFSISSLEDWKKIALQETKGKDPFDILSWRGKDGILFLPYYDAEKDADLHFLKRFQIPAAKDVEPRAWLNLPFVKISNEQTANTLALEHLSYGGDGVLFDLRDVAGPDLNALTNKIEWPSCYITFYLDNNADLLHPLSEFMKDKFFPLSVNGALFWESIPKKNNFNFYFEHCKNFCALGLLIRESAPATEISEALMNGVDAVDSFSRAADPIDVFRSICFSLPAGQSFMECIAKFKALRILWFQVARAYGHNDYKIADVHIHARSEVVPDGTLGPHQNMLKATFASMAAILGGCNSLTVQTEQDVAFTSRWARNVSSILREESFFDKVADPLAGAWALDEITASIAKKAWDLFQQKWRAYATT